MSTLFNAKLFLNNEIKQALLIQSEWGTCTLRQRLWKNDVIAPLGGIGSSGDPRPLPN